MQVSDIYFSRAARWGRVGRGEVKVETGTLTRGLYRLRQTWRESQCWDPWAGHVGSRGLFPEPCWSSSQRRIAPPLQQTQHNVTASLAMTHSLQLTSLWVNGASAAEAYRAHKVNSSWQTLDACVCVCVCLLPENECCVPSLESSDIPPTARMPSFLLMTLRKVFATSLPLRSWTIWNKTGEITTRMSHYCLRVQFFFKHTHLVASLLCTV